MPLPLVEAYLLRTSGPAFHHESRRVWCFLKPSKKDGIHRVVGAKTLSRWIMDIRGVPKHFKGGFIRMAAASKAIDDGCDPRFVLMMSRWRSWHALDAFYNRAGCRVEPKSTRQASQ